MTREKRLLGLIGTMCATAMVLTGCSKASTSTGTDSAGGEGVAPGATKEEYVAAFEDVEPITLDFQIASASSASYSAMRDLAFAEAVEEWSGGKVTLEIHYSGTIAGATDVPNALVDGRLDIAQYFTMYEPEDMRAFVDLATSLSQVPSTPLVGEILGHAVAQEVAYNTPEIMDEFTQRGMHVLYASNPNGNSAMICVDEHTSLDDWAGNQVRGNASAQQVQIEELGGTISSIEMAEGYEALQRGLLDCSLQSPVTAVANGWLEVAPHVYFPEKQSFAPGPGSVVAGSSWETLPLVAQQLIHDKLDVYTSGEMFSAMTSIHDLITESKEAGGAAQYLESETETKLAEANAALLEQVAESDSLDGAALNTAVTESIDKWTAISEDLGYVDEGGFDDFDTWYAGPSEFEDREYFEAITERMSQEIMLPRRPS